MQSSNQETLRRSFMAIVLVYLIIGSLYAWYTPDWQAPDEPAHYNYVRQLAAGQFPIMQPSDYNQEYQSEVISSGFDEQYSVEPFSYEDYQPPLYYLLQTPIFLLTQGSLTAMRLLGVILGATTLVIAYAIMRHIFVDRPFWALAAAAFFAFLPQHIAMQASVNNDSLSELLVAAMLLVALRYDPNSQKSRTQLLTLGILLGLAFLTKVTAYLVAPVIGIVILWHHWPQWRPIFQNALTAFVPAALIGSIWWLRNLIVYGWPDFLGIEAHDAVVVGQPTTREWVTQYGLPETLEQFGRTTFRSFWGQFGWMGVVMPSWIYQALFGFSLLLICGWGINFYMSRHNQRPVQVSTLPRIALWLLFGLNLALYLTYNITYVQHQGRYMFAALVPISLAVAAGAGGWLHLLSQRISGGRWQLDWLAPTGIALGLAGLALLALFRFIVPALS